MPYEQFFEQRTDGKRAGRTVMAGDAPRDEESRQQEELRK
jgi:hypothetical protein